MNKMLYKASTWTVQYLQNQKLLVQSFKNNITIYDNICFKSVNNTFMSVKENLECIALEDLHEEKSVWNMMKADTPFIPSWVY
jgi:hypothetical protein